MSLCRPNAPALSLPTAFSSSLPPPPILRKRSFARIAKLFGIGTSTPVEDDEYVNSSRRRSGSETGEANNEDEGDNDEADGEGHMDEMTLLLDAQVSKSASAVHIHTPLAFLLRESTSKRQVVIYNTACSPSTTLPWSGRTKIDTVAGRFVITSAIHRVPVLRRCRPTPYHSPAACLALGNVLLRGSSLAPNEIQPTRMPRTRARARPAPSNPRLSRRSWSPDAVQRTRRSDHLHLITLPTRHTGSSECDLK
jgi:hypothetical protein